MIFRIGQSIDLIEGESVELTFIVEWKLKFKFNDSYNQRIYS
ncbi:MAG: hypothetical protein RLZ33_1962 [Bacteroidota bacterium]|jgi:hypothetical protein